MEVLANFVALGTLLFLGLFAAFRKTADYEHITPEPMPVSEKKPIEKTRREKLYEYSKNCIGHRRGLDKSVPKELGCANALSNVLILFGVDGLPPLGIASTALLDEWLRKSDEFEIVDSPLHGDVVSFPTGSGNGSIRGHIFVAGKVDWMSNNSATGLWEAHWKGTEAIAYYVGRGGLKMTCFRLVDKPD